MHSTKPRNKKTTKSLKTTTQQPATRPTSIPALNSTEYNESIEQKYKIEINNCLRVRESSDEKDGYETCLEDIDSDISVTMDQSEQRKTTTGEDKSDENFETKSKDACLYSPTRTSGSDDDQLKSYDEQNNSFGSDQFFLVQYIDDEDADR